MPFDPKPHVTKIKGKDYIQVAHRVLWMRTDHPDWRIDTDLIQMEPFPVVKARVIDEAGQQIASAYGTAQPKAGSVYAGREIEKAETAAIGRALALAGFGTQFAMGEFDDADNDHLADSPTRPTPAAPPMTVVQGGKAAPSSTPSTPTASTPPPAKNASDDFADDLDRHFGKQDTTVDLVGDWHNVTSLTVQKANGVGNFSYVMHTDGGLHIPVFSGDVFRAAGMNPDDWKTPKHEELFSPPLEVFAHNDGKRWTVKQITVAVSA